jgi:hypothetical protein
MSTFSEPEFRKLGLEFLTGNILTIGKIDGKPKDKSLSCAWLPGCFGLFRVSGH